VPVGTVVYRLPDVTTLDTVDLELGRYFNDNVDALIQSGQSTIDVAHLRPVAELINADDVYIAARGGRGGATVLCALL
jgi:Fe-S cluster assembly ATPase SufC